MNKKRNFKKFVELDNFLEYYRMEDITGFLLVATETLRIKVVGLREINKVNTAVNKLDKAMKAINRQRVTGTKAAVKVLRQELSIKNKR